MRTIAADDRLYFMQQGISHSPRRLPIRTPSRSCGCPPARGGVRLGKGKEEGKVRCWGPRLGPPGVWCLALLLCRVLAMRCESAPRMMLARKNSRADALPAQVGGRAGLPASAPGKPLHANPRSRPAVHRRHMCRLVDSLGGPARSTPGRLTCVKRMLSGQAGAPSLGTHTVGILFVSFLAHVLTGQVLQAHPDPGGRLRQFQLMPLSPVQDSQQAWL